MLYNIYGSYMEAVGQTLLCLQSRNIPVIGDSLMAGPLRGAIVSAAALGNCSTHVESAGVGSVSTENQPSLLAHIQPVLISR